MIHTSQLNTFVLVQISSEGLKLNLIPIRSESHFSTLTKSYRDEDIFALNCIDVEYKYSGNLIPLPLVKIITNAEKTYSIEILNDNCIKTTYVTIQSIFLNNGYNRSLDIGRHFQFELLISDSANGDKSVRFKALKETFSQIIEKINILNAILANGVNLSRIDINHLFAKSTYTQNDIIKWAGLFFSQINIHYHISALQFNRKESEYSRDIYLVINGLCNINPKHKKNVEYFIFNSLNIQMHHFLVENKRRDLKYWQDDPIRIKIRSDEFVQNGVSKDPTEDLGRNQSDHFCIESYTERNWLSTLTSGLSVKEYLLIKFIKEVSPVMLNAIEIKKR